MDEWKSRKQESGCDKHLLEGGNTLKSKYRLQYLKKTKKKIKT